MQRQLQHLKARRFYDRLARQVGGGLADAPCKPRLLRSFDRLARQVLPPRDVHRFMCHSWYGRITYGELLSKANQLRVVTGTRVTAAASRQEEPEDILGPLFAFLSTGCAAAITFFVAVHFVVVMRQFFA